MLEKSADLLLFWRILIAKKIRQILYTLERNFFHFHEFLLEKKIKNETKIRETLFKYI